MWSTSRFQIRPSLYRCIKQHQPNETPFIPCLVTASRRRPFSSSVARPNWLQPVEKVQGKPFKGKPRPRTGGSTKGTTLALAEYGMRMKDHERRISAKQLRNGEETIRRRMRGLNFRLFPRITCNRAIFTKGNESRQGTGKGSFDHWAAQVTVNQVIFEMTSDAHEKVVRDAFRLASDKMPGIYEFVKKGDPSNYPIMGITRLGQGITEADLKRPRKKLGAPGGEVTADRMPSRGPSP